MAVTARIQVYWLTRAYATFSVLPGPRMRAGRGGSRALLPPPSSAKCAGASRIKSFAGAYEFDQVQ